MMMSPVADYIGPETTADLVAAFGSSVLLPSVPERDPTESKREREENGMVTGEHLWRRLWLFGLIEDTDVVSQRSCGDLWRPEGRIANGYYIPDDEDTEVSIDNPPNGVWDARTI